MNVAGTGMRVVVATRPVDFRKGHDGLAAVVEHELGLDPYSGVAVVFRPKRLDRMKVLWWDGTGLVLASKRLEAGRLCVACGARRSDAAVEGAVRGPVRGAGLAPDVEPAGAQTALSGVTTGGCSGPLFLY